MTLFDQVLAYLARLWDSFINPSAYTEGVMLGSVLVAGTFLTAGWLKGRYGAKPAPLAEDERKDKLKGLIRLGIVEVVEARVETGMFTIPQSRDLYRDFGNMFGIPNMVSPIVPDEYREKRTREEFRQTKSTIRREMDALSKTPDNVVQLKEVQSPQKIAA